jgi:hypothetical protein
LLSCTLLYLNFLPVHDLGCRLEGWRMVWNIKVGYVAHVCHNNAWRDLARAVSILARRHVLQIRLSQVGPWLVTLIGIGVDGRLLSQVQGFFE